MCGVGLDGCNAARNTITRQKFGRLNDNTPKLTLFARIFKALPQTMFYKIRIYYRTYKFIFFIFFKANI
jgi:hypothetical protein